MSGSGCMSEMAGIGAAVIGTGFIGLVHAETLRRMGVRVVGVLGSSPERGAEKAPAMGAAKAYATLEELAADPEVDVVHITSPNKAHYPQAKALIAAGKHVLCEKPLAMSSAQSAELAQMARQTDRICAVNYNVRFYPLNMHAHAMVRDGDLGDIHMISGHYLQDWLFKDTDWNWRLEVEEGGPLRSFGDIGTHWVDLTSFITGQKVTSVMAELATVIKVRQQPVGPVETFSQGGTGETVPRQIETDDVSMLLLRYANGARGSVTISQVSAGHRNGLKWQVDGLKAAAGWHSETPEQLWIGHRDRPNEVLHRDASMMKPEGAAATMLPGGHAEGFADAFHGMFRAVYAAVAAGKRPASPLYATFDDGHYEMLICDAVLKSAETGSYTEIGNG